MSVEELTVEHERRSRILIPDPRPISLLAMIGSDALDWLFVPNADVWIPDMIKTEATRPPIQVTISGLNTAQQLLTGSSATRTVSILSRHTKTLNTRRRWRRGRSPAQNPS